MPITEEKVVATKPPIEMKRGPRPAGWGQSQQLEEDLKSRREEWQRREARLIEKGKLSEARPFPGLNR